MFDGITPQFRNNNDTFDLTKRKKTSSYAYMNDLKDEMKSLIRTLESKPTQTVRIRTYAHLSEKTNKLTQILKENLIINQEASYLIERAQAFLPKSDTSSEKGKEKVDSHSPSHPSWLKTVSNLPKVDEKLLIHMLGGDFAMETGLEGKAMIDPLSFLIKFLKDKPDFLRTEAWLSLNSRLDSALHLANVFERGLENQSFEILKMAIENVTPEKPLLIPGGWKDEPHGHAVYFEIILQENGLYTLRTYNSGEGLQYHGTPYDSTFKSLYPSFLEIKDIEKVHLLNPNFLHSFLEINQKRGDAEILYEKILPLLQGQVSHRTLELENLMGEQRSGTCSWKSLKAVLRASLSYNDYKVLLFRLDYQCLWGFYEANSIDLATDDRKRNLLKMTSENFSREVENLRKANSISEEEFIQAIGMLSTIRESIEAAENSQKEVIQAPLVPTSADALSWSKIDPSAHKGYPSLFRVSPNKKDKISSDKADFSQKLLEASKTWAPSPVSLLSDITTFSQLAKESIEDNQTEAVNDFFIQVMRRLPIPSADPNSPGSVFWQEVAANFDEKQIDEIMENFSQLAQYYLKSSYCIDGSPALFPSRVYAALKALYIQEILKDHSSLVALGLGMPADFSCFNEIFSEPSVHGLAYRQLAFRSKDPLISGELASMYADLKNRATAYRNLAFVPESSKYGFPSSYFLSPDKADEKWFVDPLNPEFAYVKRVLRKNNDKVFPKDIFSLYCSNQLSPAFVAWRDQVYLSQHFLQNFPSGVYQKKQARSIGLQYTHEGEKDEKTWNLKDKDPTGYRSLNIEEGKHWDIFSRKDIEETNLFLDPVDQDVKKSHYSTRFHLNIRPIQNESLNKILYLWKKNGVVSQSDAYSKSFSDIDLSLREKRELISLGLCKPLQIAETIAFFSKNQHLLNDPDYQTFFNLLLFEEDLLLKELKNSPEMVEVIQNFVRKGFQIAHDAGHLETAAFYLNLSRHLEKNLLYALPEARQEDHPFLDHHRELLQLIHYSVDPHEKSPLYEELIASYSDVETINHEDLLLILSAQVALQIYPTQHSLVDPEIREEQRVALLRLHDQIDEGIKENPEEIINAILQRVIPDYEDLKWEEERYPVFHSKGFEIDLSSGSIFKEKQSLRDIPSYVFSDPFYKEVFDRQYSGTMVAMDTFVFEDHKGDSFKIILKGRKDFILQRYSTKHKEWFTAVPSFKQLDHKGKPVFSQAIEKQYIPWVSHLDMLLTHRKDGSICEASFAFTTGNKANMHLSHLVELERPSAVGSDPLTWMPTEAIAGSSFDFLLNFEDKEYITIWVDKHKKPELIEFQRYNLTFKLDERDPDYVKWTCDQLPGFFLSAEQSVPPLGNFSHFLLLNNAKGVKKVVVPSLAISAPAEGGLLTGKFSLDPDHDHFEQKYFIYDLKSKKGEIKQSLEPTSPAAFLRLAYFMMGSLRYVEARNYLTIHKLPLKGNMQEELGILKQIVHMRKTNQDHTPKAIALRLHAAFLHEELQQRMGKTKKNKSKEDEEFWRFVAKDCNLYIDRIHKLGSFRLPVEEEKIILRAVYDNTKEEDTLTPYVLKYLESIDDSFTMPSVNPKTEFFSFHKKNDVYVERKCRIIEEACNPQKGYSLTQHLLNSNAPLSTQLTNIGEQGLLGLWNAIQTTNNFSRNKEKQKEIRDRLILGICHDDSTQAQVLSAVIEMIVAHPSRYRFDSSLKKYLPIKWKEITEEERILAEKKWYSKNIVPILEDYLREYPTGVIPQPVKGQDRYAPISEETLTSERKVKKAPDRVAKELLTLSPHSLYIKDELGSLDELSDAHKKIKFSTFLTKLSEETVQAEFAARKAHLQDTAKKLHPIFETKPDGGRVVNNEFKRIGKDCSHYLKENTNPDNAEESSAIKLESLPMMCDQLATEIKITRQLLAAKEQCILAFVNETKITAEDLAAASAQALYLSSKREPLTMANLMIIYARKDMDKLRKPPTELSSSDITFLTREIKKYFKQATYLQKLERSLEKATAIQTQIADQKIADHETVQELISELKSKRAFAIDEHPECLIIEYYANIQLRGPQVEKLEEFLQGGDFNVVKQMIMSFGKTSTLTPLLLALFADGNNLAVFMLPEPLLESASIELILKMAEAYGITMHPFLWSRESDYSVENLRNVKEKLLRVIEEKECLLMDPVSMHCFYLQFLETWFALPQSTGKQREELKKQFIEMRDIINIFRHKGFALCDEWDSITNCRSEVNYTAGELARLDDAQMEVLILLYETLITDFTDVVKLECDPHNQNAEASPFTEKLYLKDIKTRLAGTLITKLGVHTFDDQSTTAAVQKLFTETDANTLIVYLCQDKENDLYQDACRFVKEIDNPIMRDIIELGKEELTRLLTLSLENNSDEQYGLSKKETVLHAIPYHQGHVNEGSQFANPHETANYTLQAYLNHGIKPSLVKREIEALQKLAMDELKEGNILQNTKAYKAFMELCGKDTSFHLLKLTPKNLETITSNINGDPSIRRKFWKNYILKSITFHTRKLNSGPQTIGAFFHRINAFTGTTWNKKTSPEKMITRAEKGTDAKTLFILMGQPEARRKVLEVPHEHPFAFLKKLPLEENGLALLDSGAYTKGPSFLQCAEVLLDRFEAEGSPIKGIVIHDHEDKEVVVEKDKIKGLRVTPIQNCSLGLHERFTVFAKPFTTGTNIPQSPTAVAYMTIGRDIILRDLLQTAWRMRKIDKGQQIQFIVADDIKKIILETLKKPLDSELKLEDIIAYAAIGQANLIGDDNYLSMKQKMLEVIQEAIREILLDPDLDPEDAARLCTDEIQNIFAPKMGTSPTELYGAEEIKAPAEDVLDLDVQRHIKMLVAAIESSPILQEKLPQKETEEKIENCKNSKIVAEELSYSPQEKYNQNVRVQQEAKEEQQKLLESRTQQFAQVQGDGQNDKQWRYFPWPEGDPLQIFDPSFYRYSKLNLIGNWTWSLLPSVPKPIAQFSQSVWQSLPALPQFMKFKATESVGAHASKALSMAWEGVYEPPWPYQMQEFLSQDSKLEPITSAVSKDIRISFNLAPSVKFRPTDKTIEPFDNDQKPIKQMLVSKAANGKTEIILLDQNDAGYFKEKLQNSITFKEDLEPDVSDIGFMIDAMKKEPDLKVCLYDVRLGVIQQGKYPLTEEDLQDKDLQLLVTQTKFLAGETSYTAEEKELLKEWMHEHSPSEMKKAYETRVLQNNPDRTYIMKALEEVWEV